MRSKGSKKGKDQTEIIFDPAARREFLTGFSKRKKERQEKARKEMEEQIKEEKRIIKEEIRKASNMHIHNAIVEDKVKHLRELQGLSENKTVTEEADGQQIEVCEIGMTADLSGVVESVENEANKKEEDENEEESGKAGVSNTRKKKLITKQTRLQKMTKDGSGRKRKKKAAGTFQKTKNCNVNSSKKKRMALKNKYQKKK